MSVKAIIPGVGEVVVQGAASEATLQALLGAFKGFKGEAGAPQPGAGGAGAGDDANAPGKIRKQVADATVGALKESAGTASKMYSDAFSNQTPGIKNFTGVLADFAPVGKDVIKNFGGVIGDQVEIFRNLSTVGIDLGDSILQAQLATGQARLPLEVFGKTIKENSTTFSNAFGGATAGASKFAEISGKVMDKQGQNLARLGFSIDEIAEYSASYIEQMQRSGRAQSMSTSELAAGAEKYNLELDKLSKATGISRQQLDEANKAAQRDTRMRLALSNLGDTERAAVTAKLEELKKLDPTGKMAAGFADLIAGGGVALTKEARNFTLAMQQSGVDASKMTRDIYSGQKGAVDQMNAGFSRAAKEAQNMSEGQKRTTTALATMGVETPMYMKATLAGMGDSQKKIDEANKAQAEKLKSADPTRGVAGLDQTLTNVQNSLKKTFIESGVLQDTATGLSGAAVEANKFVQSMQGMNTPTLLATLFGAGFAKEIAKSLADIAIAAGSGYAAGKLAGGGKKETPGAEPEGKKPKTPEGPDGKKPPGAGKVGEEVADELDKKGSWWKRAADAFKKNKVVLGVLTAGGTLVVFSEEAKEIASTAVDKITGTNFGGREIKSTTEYLDNNKPPVAGAEVPKAAVEPLKNPVTEATQASIDRSGEVVRSLNQNVRELNESLKTINWNQLIIPETVGTSIDAGSIKLKNLRDEITTTTSAFKDLNNTNLDQLNNNITKLSETIKSSMKSEQKEGAPGNVKVSDASSKEMVDLLNQLNMNMSQLVSHQSDAVDYLSKTAKYTRQTSNNSA